MRGDDRVESVSFHSDPNVANVTPMSPAKKQIPRFARDDKLHHACRSDYFSLRQLTEPRFSTVLDSISMSKPLRSRYLSVITWPVPSSDTP